MKQLFVVTCHGWCGSSWLAHVLDSHPNVTCTHMLPQHRPSQDDCDEKFSQNRYFDTIRAAMIARIAESMDVQLDNLAADTNVCFVGNVGLYRLRDIPFLVKRFGGPARNVRIINLVRHPVSVVYSGYGQFKKRFRYDLHELSWNLQKLLKYKYDYIMNTADVYGFDPGAIDALSFFSALQVLASLKLDADALNEIQSLDDNIEFLGSVTMEAITSSSVALKQLHEQLFPKMNKKDCYYAQLATGAPINSHHGGAKLSPADKFASLTDWQREAYVHFWQESNLQDVYESFGYDFSFLADTRKEPSSLEKQ